MFDRILIANRGEIACRIIRTCRRLGVETVAVHSDVDANSLFVKMADQAVSLGGAAPSESYLLGNRVIEAARETGSQAIHPGYGFLSENAGFARACQEAGIVFIGPDVQTIERMGSKADAKATMETAGVPVVPGYHGADQDDSHLARQAVEIGFPLMIKAAAGGGGKGMRIVRSKDDFNDALASARREASNAFGDDRMIMERYIESPLHIEVQVFGDSHGNVVHLFERDCSTQRRYQKIIEEAPAPRLAESTREQMLAAAVLAARSVEYVNAGTVEFIAEPDGDFFFMEMNTRLQVEHPVTEAITGFDLVEWQLRVAAGEPLPVAQDEITSNGHSIEVRLYAEDPATGFLPSTGTIDWLEFPDFARVDTAVASGDQVSVHYDPMIAKLIVWGSDRRAARLKMRHALARTAIGGLKTNLAFLADAIARPVFVDSEVHTALIDADPAAWIPDAVIDPMAVVAASVVHMLVQESQSRQGQTDEPDRWSPWAVADGWRPGHPGKRVLSMSARGVDVNVDARGFDGHYQLQSGSYNWVVSHASVEGDRLRFRVDDHTHTAVFLAGPDAINVQTGDGLYLFRFRDPFAPELGEGASADAVAAPMPGKLAVVKVNVGDTVEDGQSMAVMEAMKMEISLDAPRAGTIKAIHAQPGEFVEADTVIIELEKVE